MREPKIDKRQTAARTEILNESIRSVL